MGAELSDRLDPAAVSRLGGLEVIARALVEGFLKGLHFSAAKGASIEFAEHRPYVPGDEIRRIDWRTFGRTDRFYLKEYEDETNARVTLFLDASGSMGFQSGAISKLRYGTCLAAALGCLLIWQHDAVGLVVDSPADPKHVPPKATAQHLRGIFQALESAKAGGLTRLAGSLHETAERLKRRSMVLVFSDFLDDPRAVIQSVAHLRHSGAEVLLFHIVDPAEEEFPFTNWTVFRDSEDPSASLRVDARQIREIYKENLASHMETLRRGFSAAGADHCLMSTLKPFDASLAAFLDFRSRRRR